MIDWYDFLGRALQNRRRRRFLNGAHRVHLVEMTVRTNHEVLPGTRWVFKRGHRISPRSTICLRLGTGVGEHRTRFRENHAFENERRKEREQHKTDHGAPQAQSIWEYRYTTLPPIRAHVRYWHEAEMQKYLGKVRYWMDSVKHLLALSFSGFDPNVTTRVLCSPSWQWPAANQIDAERDQCDRHPVGGGRPCAEYWNGQHGSHCRGQGHEGRATVTKNGNHAPVSSSATIAVRIPCTTA